MASESAFAVVNGGRDYEDVEDVLAFVDGELKLYDIVIAYGRLGRDENLCKWIDSHQGHLEYTRDRIARDAAFWQKIAEEHPGAKVCFNDIGALEDAIDADGKSIMDAIAPARESLKVLEGED